MNSQYEDWVAIALAIVLSFGIYLVFFLLVFVLWLFK